MLDVLQNPTAYEIACLFPQSVRVDRKLQDGELFTWKGIRLTSYYFPGQTLYHAGLLAERDGYRVFFYRRLVRQLGS